MKLEHILKEIGHIKRSNFNPSVSFLTCDTNKIKKDTVYI